MIIYGKQVVLHILHKHPNLIEEVIFSKEIDKKVFSKFLKLGKKVIRVDNKKAQSLAHGGNHQGYFLKLKEFEYTAIETLKALNFIVVLDGLTDMGNIGAITRTAYSLGIDGLIVSGIKNINPPSIVRTSAGAALDLPFSLYANSADLVNELKQCGFTIIGATMDGVDLKKYQSLKKEDKVALFLGSEGEGLSKKVQKHLDLKVAVNMSNEFDSLNVSVAAGILMYHLKGK
jgi:23S rRNA (guanosine2251-2'-O)-methyltransferase